MAQTPDFAKGIKDLTELSGTWTTAVMCSEREPAECHRALLVARELQQMGHTAAHILPDRPEPLEHRELEQDLMRRWGAQSPGEALDRQAGKAAYRRRKR